MKNLLILGAAAVMATSCSSTHMSELAPETAGCEIGNVAVGGFNAASVVTYCRNPQTGCLETAGVQVHRDSGVNNVGKIAASAGYIAGGAGSVLSGIGSYKYGQAFESFADNGFNYNFSGIPGSNINVEGSSAYAGGSNVNANATGGYAEGGSAYAESYVKNVNKPTNNVGVSNDVRIGGRGGKGGGFGGGKGGGGKGGSGGMGGGGIPVHP